MPDSPECFISLSIPIFQFALKKRTAGNELESPASGSLVSRLVADQFGFIYNKTAAQTGLKRGANHKALLEAIQYALASKAKGLHVFSDSEVVVKQMRGKYSCGSSRLYSLELGVSQADPLI